MKKTLERAAKAGRYGDDSLLHVSKAELRGLASLHPEGRLPKNPETGLPEAFFFLPFLAGIGSMLGGATAAATAIPAMTAATTAASAIPAATAATLGSTLGTAALPAAAEAATLGATAATSALPAATAATLPAATAATTAPNALAAAAPAALTKGILPAGIDTLTTGSVTPSILANPATTAATTSLPSVAANPATAPLFKPALDAAVTNTVTPSTIAAPSSVTPAPGLVPPPVTPPSTIPGINATTTSPTLLGPAPSSPGISSLLGGSNMSQMMQMMAPLATMMGGSGVPEMEDQEQPKLKKTTYHRGRVSFKGSGDGEHDYFPDDKYTGDRKAKRKFAMGGLVRGYAEGGIASLDNSSGEMSDKDLIEATKEAILAQSPDANQLVQMFLATFGQAAFADLLSSIQGAPQQSDGLSDSVPAAVQGKDGAQGIAALSEGEFVVPSDVVSGLGNGSTDAGAKQLHGMMSKVRSARSNGAKQPEAINPSDVMPV